MTTPTELRSEIAASREAFRAALRSGGEGWERASAGGEWTPRRAAEHAISADYLFAGWGASVLGRDGPGRPELSLGSAEEALSVFAASSEVADAIWGAIEAEQLEQPAPPMDDVAAAMRLVASHLSEHAEQIGAM